MNAKDNIKDFPDLVKLLLASAIQRNALEVGKGQDHVVFLENGNCQLRFSGINSHRVLCSFSSKLNEAHLDFDLALYLFVAFGDEAQTIFPPADSEVGDKMRLRHDLEKYNDLLMGGRLDGPLGGDFSWAERYAAMETEYMGLSDALESIYATGCEKVRAKIRTMRDQWNGGDFSWITDARKTLADRMECVMPP